MLDLTLSTPFVPGTNLKGDVTGANWTFLLPCLDRRQVVTVGVPSDATLRALAGRARRVVVVCESPREQARADRLITSLNGGTGSSAAESSTGARSAAAEIALVSRLDALDTYGTDLIVVAGRGAVRRLLRDAAHRAALRRILAPEGFVYFDRAGRARSLENAAGGELERTFGPALPLWLTPLAGEMHTAVPLADRQTIDWFLTRGHDSRAVTVQSLRGLRGSNGPAAGAPSSGSSPAASAATQPHHSQDDSQTDAPCEQRAPRSARFTPGTIARAAGRGFVALCGALEGSIQRTPLLRRACGRTGLLLGSDAALPRDDPPRYLRELAAASGIDLAGWRWGLAAGGEYSSRKLVFFLFEGADPQPHYVVKLTRDPRFNARLERERSALEALHDAGIDSADSLPRVAFAGTHGGLAIVGETFVDGLPFDARSTFRPDCPLAASAVEWLTRLGEATADRSAIPPDEAAAVLARLCDRFAEIYRLSAGEKAFLDEQIQSIANSSAPLPLVFQHGDPGRWNVLATSDESIAFLDWEAAETRGVPLWDLFYFLRSFSVGVGTASSPGLDVVEAFRRQVVENTPCSRAFALAVAQYCRRTGTPERLIEPLFHTCWMHRALKEATRLRPAEVRSGRYFQLLRLCMAQRREPGLARLFSSGATSRIETSVAAMGK